MKHVCLYIGLLLLLSTKSFGQGTDVIFLIDNSGSITGNINTTGAAGTEYNDMYNSIQSIMAEVLECNPDNKITIAQYSAVTSTNPRIYIESDFTNVAGAFFRRYNTVGNVPGAVNLLAAALNGASPSVGQIFGTTILNRTPGNALAVFLFTDAPRNSDLLSNNVAGPNNEAGFSAFTNLKNFENAKFVVVNTETTATTVAASAGIASTGGSYTGAIESYTTDPDGAATPPRRFINTSFSLTATQVETVTDFLCTIIQPECVNTLILTTAAGNDVVMGQDNRQASLTITASNKINPGTVGVYHAGQEVVLTPGFHAANGSRFRGYILDCPGDFNGRHGNFDDGEAQEVSNREIKFFNIAPNPANSIITVTSTEEMGSVTIISQDGKTLYNRAMPGKTTTVDIPVGNFSNGIYTVTVTTLNGKVQTDKLVKN
jgi:hypothetical protein